MLGVHEIGRFPLGVLFDDPAPAGGIVDYYFADRGKTTSADDSPAHTHFEARALQPITWRRSIVGDRLGGRVVTSYGEIVLLNTDGGINGLLQHNAIDGRVVRVKFGAADWDYKNYITLFEGTAAGWRFGGRGEVFIEPRGIEYRLEQSIQTNHYAGTGGAEGGDDLKGKEKPLAFGGVIKNVSPPLVEAGGDGPIYQLHDPTNYGAMQSVAAIRDKGAVLPLDSVVGDVASYAALQSASVAAGEYATSLAAGVFKTGSVAAGTITADFSGAKAGPSSTFIDKIGAIIGAIAETSGGLPTREIVGGSLVGIDVADPYPVALWIGTQDRSILSVLDELVAGRPIWWGANLRGQLDMCIVEPAAGSWDQSFDESEIFEFEWLKPPAAVNPSVKRSHVAYARNYTLQTSDLAGSITDADRQFVAEEFRFPTPAVSTKTAINLLARELRSDRTALSTEAGAVATQTRLIDLYVPTRRYARVVVGHKGFTLDMCREVRVDSPRYDARNLLGRIIGIALDAAAGRVELTVLF